MKAYQIQDVRDFMKKLLLADTFDTFLLTEAAVTTYVTFHVDGQLHEDYFGADEAEQLAVEKCGYVLWRRLRPFFFELMKGKNTPLSFRIVFRLAPHNVSALIRQSGLAVAAEDVDGLFLNVRYDGKELVCTSGTALHVFSLDKSLEHAWDGMLERFFKKKEIPFV